MNRQKSQTLILVLLILLPIVLIFGVYFIFRPHERELNLPVPVVEFRQKTGIAEVILSEISLSQDLTGEAPDFSLSELSGTLNLLDDGRIMFPGYPVCVYFDLEGNELGRLQLEEPEAEIYKAGGLDYDESSWLIHPGYIIASAATESGRVYSLFADRRESVMYEPIFDPGDKLMFIEWDSKGRSQSITDLIPIFEQYDYLARSDRDEKVSWGYWAIDTDGERVVVSNDRYVYLLVEPGRDPILNQCERAFKDCPGLLLDLHGDYLYSACGGVSPVRYRLDGSVDWDWLRAVTKLAQPVPTSENERYYARGLILGLLPDRREIAISPQGAFLLGSDGNPVQELADKIAAQNRCTLKYTGVRSIFHYYNMPGGWLEMHSVSTYLAYCGIYGASIYYCDTNFSISTTIDFSVDTTPPGEPEYGVLARSEPEEYELPLVGDIADLRYVYRDFHPVEGGYQGIDYTRRRVITLDENFMVTDVFDRTNPQNGLWQDIDVCRTDSRGYYYILDRSRNLIQVLDQDGNYVRRHKDLGKRLFNTTSQISELHIDQFDRLWVLSSVRIYVLDRDGNLLRIFESMNAPYARKETDEYVFLPPEETIHGYTVLAGPGIPGLGPDPQTPVQLPVSMITGVEFPRGESVEPGLFYVEDAGSNEIILFNWNGEELLSIDLVELNLPSERRLVVGQDGYLYLLDGFGSRIIVLNPTGEEIAEIDVQFLPSHFQERPNYGTVQSSGVQVAARTFIDADGRLNILTSEGEMLLVYPLRADDPLEPVDTVELFTDLFDEYLSPEELAELIEMLGE